MVHGYTDVTKNVINYNIFAPRFIYKSVSKLQTKQEKLIIITNYRVRNSVLIFDKDISSGNKQISPKL